MARNQLTTEAAQRLMIGILAQARRDFLSSHRHLDMARVIYSEGVNEFDEVANFIKSDTCEMMCEFVGGTYIDFLKSLLAGYPVNSCYKPHKERKR